MATQGMTGDSVGDQPPTPADKFEQTLLRAAAVVLGVGLLAAVLYAVPRSPGSAFGVIGAAVATAGAAAACGGVLGFLFGIPKTLQSDQLDGKAVRYLANTNLEEISDWLTKIIVGVGLIQIATLPAALRRLGNWLGPLFGGEPHSPAFAIVYAGYFAVSAFLLLYLWTRSRLRGVLQAADADLTEKIEGVLTQRGDANADALSLVERQLTGQNPPSQQELDQAIRRATPEWLVQIFRLAEDQRHTTWRSDKAAMERTIPVFRALIARDTAQQFPRHFASLGYALKDSPMPRYAEAEQALSTAISVRDRRGRFGGTGMMEWNRAVCRILLDPAYAVGRPSAPDVQAAIGADLRVAADRLPRHFLTTSTEANDHRAAVSRWIELNGLEVAPTG
ncbi:conserved hypothetical protein [Kribbella flavida DSM 17836]|uniref:Uncharacterized protein n=1 Tax=Kribbella flavida (strain DSM 17836 / JCM 10339 / NBRC 14399) TaxID=479435 RepID=D2PN06_KRIFD|nr:hypothetical protein [Kribbella flavida]ADB32708.1 conserved hypothetical protein [Kribbella flavida DSM 17836]